MLTDEVVVHQSDGRVTLCCENSHKWFGGVILAFMAFWIFRWCSGPNANTGISFWIGLIVAAGVFVPAGLFIALPREIKTTFDLRSRVMEHRTTYAGGLYVTKREVPFAQIEGVGLQEYNNQGFSYAPVAKLKNGKRLSFATSNGGHVQHQAVIDVVSAATGIALLTLPAKRR